jgi:hypothetical protein
MQVLEERPLKHGQVAIRRVRILKNLNIKKDHQRKNKDH